MGKPSTIDNYDTTEKDKKNMQHSRARAPFRTAGPRNLYRISPDLVGSG
jgi:hypothetical protein